MSKLVLPFATLLLIILVNLQYYAFGARPHGLAATAEIVHYQDCSHNLNLTSSNTKDGYKMNLSDSQATTRRQPTSSNIRKSSNQKENGSKNNMEVSEMVTNHNRHSTKHYSSRKRIAHQARLLGSETRGEGTSVTYRVPHQKRGEQQPGFNLDYSPPKVHPPHHN